MAVTLNANTSTGFIATSDTSGVLQLQTGGTTAVTVDASQNVGIGTASPTSRLTVSGSADLVADLNSTNASGGYMVWRTNSTVIADLGTAQNIFGTGGSDTFGINARSTRPLLFGTNNTERMRINAGAPILCLSGGSTTATGTGIAFPATQSASSDANTLDDYEEGTWTPTLSSTGTAPTVSAYDTQQGIYTRVGNLVTVTASVRATISSVGTGVPLITGFPFSSAGFLEGVSVGLCTILTGVSSSLGWWYVSGATVQVASAATYNTNAQAYLTFTASYRVA